LALDTADAEDGLLEQTREERLAYASAQLHTSLKAMSAVVPLWRGYAEFVFTKALAPRQQHYSRVRHAAIMPLASNACTVELRTRHAHPQHPAYYA
jgi:hypothetical protein